MCLFQDIVLHTSGDWLAGVPVKRCVKKLWKILSTTFCHNQLIFDMTFDTINLSAQHPDVSITGCHDNHCTGEGGAVGGANYLRS